MDKKEIIKRAEERIYRCKESAYGKNTNASNVSEGDYGSWKDWENELIEFAIEILQSLEQPEEKCKCKIKQIDMRNGKLYCEFCDKYI
jgi:hypothetical protein